MAVLNRKWGKFLKIMKNIYSDMANRYDILDPETELEYLRKYKTGDEAQRSRALDFLLKSNIRLIINIARKFARPGSGLDIEDVIQEGCIGFKKAVDDFDFGHESRLSTYATFWIRQTISRYSNGRSKAVAIPEYIANDIQNISRFEKEFEQRNGVQPTEKEIVLGTELSAKAVRRAKTAAAPVTYINTEIGDDGDEIGDIIENLNSPDPAENIEMNGISACISNAASGISGRENMIIDMRYGLSGHAMSADEISAVFNVEPEFVRSTLSRKLEKR